jgi:hypothetical protein
MGPDAPAHRFGDDRGSDPIAEQVPWLAGLITAGAISSLVCSAPPSDSLSWGEVVLSAAVCVLAAFLSAAAAAWVLGSIISFQPRPRARRGVLKIACLAAGFAPLTLLLQERSALGMAVAAGLAAAATLWFAECDEASGPALRLNDSPGLLADQVFVDLHARPLLRDLLPALWVVGCAEAAGLAQMTSHAVMAAGLSGASSAALARSFARQVPPQESRVGSRADSPRNPLLALGLALFLTIIGLLPFLRSGWAHSAIRHFSSVGASERRRVRAAGHPLPRSVGTLAGDRGGTYSGIVLWPDHPQTVKLVAPRAPTRNPFAFGVRASILSIPFDGVYWVFQAPDLQPSAQSHIAHGSPDMFNIRSTDGRPLRLEARQNLGTLIDLACCSDIRVAIQNTDRYPGTVSLELILRNTTLPDTPSQSLGTAMVASTRPGTLGGKGPAASEVLSFNIPPDLKLRQFDEVSVVFQLSPRRSNVGAKIGIERFTLVPRSLP